MTYLELCKRLRQEAQIAGSGPSSVQNQTGENKALVDWINSAWLDIQLMYPNWMWMKGEFQFNTANDKMNYTPTEAGIASRFAMWDRESMRIYQTSLGPRNSLILPFIGYAPFRSYYMTAHQASGRPEVHSINNKLELVLGHTPNNIQYTIVGEYTKTAQRLIANADIPEMPEDYHMMIVYRALIKYARAEAAAEIYQDAKTEFTEYKRRLELNQLPPVELGGTLVE